MLCCLSLCCIFLKVVMKHVNGKVQHMLLKLNDFFYSICNKLKKYFSLPFAGQENVCFYHIGFRMLIKMRPNISCIYFKIHLIETTKLF